MSKKDYYKILELPDEDKKLQGEEFTQRIKNQYRTLAKKYHPDKFANKTDKERQEAEEKFKEITEAYDALSTPEKRQQYDTFGQTGNFNFEGFRSTGMADIDEMLRRFHNRGFNPFNPFGDMGEFENMNSAPKKPQPLRIKLQVSLLDLYQSKKKKIRYKRFTPCINCDGKGFDENGKIEPCPTCHGSGFVSKIQRNGWMTMQENMVCNHCQGSGEVVVNGCKHCGGKGRVVSVEELEIQIPEETTQGSTFVVVGMGNYAERNKELVGDLLIMVDVIPDSRFEIVNHYDLGTYVEIPVLDCITGCDTKIRFIDGKDIPVSIPKFTKDGAVLAINGKGLKGDGSKLYVKVKHKFPTNLTSEEINTINDLKKSKNFKK